MSGAGRSLRLLAAMLLALLLPAAVIGLLVALERPEASPVVADLARVRLLSGQGEQGPEAVTVSRYLKDRVILVVTGQPVDAASHPLLRLRLEGVAPEASARFFWVDALEQAPLTQEIGLLTDGISHHIDLSLSPGWKGTVTEYGVIVTDPAHRGFRLSELALLPASLEGWLWNLLSECLYFEPWSQRSVNFEAGVMDRKRGLCTPLVAAWVVLAWLIFSALVWQNPWRIGRGPLLALLLTGWGLLEAKWLWNGTRQLQQSAALFAGKDDGAALAATFDAPFYGYADRLMREVLPQPPVNLFILASPQSSGYMHQRLSYFLLPHNIYNNGQPPVAGYRRKGGYLLVLAGNPKVTYDAGRQELLLPKGGPLAATRIDRDPLGDLYRIEAK